ncbi:hypothetical protein P154DRAFT_517397 [Amniculicola lignicola CBS 123094]|uniref:Uncharacterized protein n=1 Tax=Amniculicola lignicola CBS 123094 TaxID=1392246 RepID=A0A6A5X0B7_9PLEO|nr:hypothetical protein P154DRAFT_517397 [Amniculicola lignicola CBS 123094]
MGWSWFRDVLGFLSGHSQVLGTNARSRPSYVPRHGIRNNGSKNKTGGNDDRSAGNLKAQDGPEVLILSCSDDATVTIR